MAEQRVPVRDCPALEVSWSVRPDDDHLERLLAEIDDESPAAVEEHAGGLRVFFAAPAARGRAAVKLIAFDSDLVCTPVDVPDEGWAERSQASLAAVTIGRVTVAPPWSAPESGDADVRLVIQPSMGFGTGHHASTRLCLSLLQRMALAGTTVLDVGTGSGVLALAARKLGATTVVGIDVDPDALESARQNLELNGEETAIALRAIELAHAPHSLDRVFDVVLANLTGAALSRDAVTLGQLANPAGVLIVGGVQQHESAEVRDRLHAAGWAVSDRAEEDGWVGLALRRG